VYQAMREKGLHNSERRFFTARPSSARAGDRRRTRMWQPMSPIGPRLGRIPLPISYWPLLRTQLAYVALTLMMKVAGT
jgi:hypothetical protein